MIHTEIFPSINLEGAMIIARATLAHGRQAGMRPIAVAVLDVRGALKAYMAEDGTSLYRQRIAQGKAMGALGMGTGGRELEHRAAAAPLFASAVQALMDGNLVPVQGGVLIRDDQGRILGAVGVSGDLSSNDELCAVAGISAAGLAADCGEASS